MSKFELNQEIVDKLEKLNDKFQKEGQDLSSYLDGLLETDYLTYWDYINLNALLNLQQPKTAYSDEMIFIVYHQITELYFKLILWELQQLCSGEVTKSQDFLDKIRRVSRYFEQLISSFSVVTQGMDRKQFGKFRTALLPASGFQSVQYRLIELHSTDIKNLVSGEYYLWLSDEDSIEAFFDKIYWKKGAIDAKTGEKNLTLRQFENEYEDRLISEAKQLRKTNLSRRLSQIVGEQWTHEQEIVEALKQFDYMANVQWPLAHFKTTVRHLQSSKGMQSSTGGTNWRSYLPPRFQRIIFFPNLWTEEEKENWGKSWAMDQMQTQPTKN